MQRKLLCYRPTVDEWIENCVVPIAMNWHAILGLQLARLCNNLLLRWRHLYVINGENLQDPDQRSWSRQCVAQYQTVTSIYDSSSKNSYPAICRRSMWLKWKICFVSDFAVQFKSIFMKLFSASNLEIVNFCQTYLRCTSPACFQKTDIYDKFLFLLSPI